MKSPRITTLIGFVVIAFLGQWVQAIEATWEYSVQVSASVEMSPPKVTLSWPQDSSAAPNGYTVYRKSPDSGSWGGGTSLPANASSYVDTSVSAGSSYEYQVVKSYSGFSGYGYICVALGAPVIDNRGKVVLIVDSTYASELTTELNRLHRDLIGDGWTVLRHDVARNASPATVKNIIRGDYNADPSGVKTVFLFGHVPVPYSGNIVPDGHYPDHQGAWPADVYYGDMDGNWTDGAVNNGGANESRNRNSSGDGKFDQSDIPSAVELQVGRVDLANMPGRRVWGGPATFPSELQLLRNYLNKDHNFRHKIINPPRRAVIHDSFGVRGGESFAASGYRAFAPLLGNQNVTTLANKGEWMPNLRNNHYLWAYGCGAGSYSSIGGLGNSGQYQDGTTTELYDHDIKAVFTMLMGSWLGDWDSEDNIMRAVLATPSMGLTCAWSGRPHWYFHHMGIGYPIGKAALITQNNGNNLYRNQINSAATLIHIGLMGDPTLRLHSVAPPANFVASSSGGGVNLSWSASSDNNIVGYLVYRGASGNGPFSRATPSIINSTSYTDANGSASSVYMVRAVKVETSPSGSYYNPSQGVFASVGGTTPPPTTNPPNNNPPNNNPPPTTTPPPTTVPPPTTLPTITIVATDATTVEGSGNPATFTITRTGPITTSLRVNYQFRGTAYKWSDYRRPEGDIPESLTIPAGARSTVLRVVGVADNETEQNETIVVALAGSTTYKLGSPNTATATILAEGGGTPGNTPPTGNDDFVVWVDDNVPGTQSGGSGGDGWNWETANPAPFRGSRAHQSAVASGLHEHWFDWAYPGLTVNDGESLVTYVYLDPANPPREIMLHWNDGSTEHRAYWGANLINYGANGTASRRYMGALPAAGRWVRLEVPATSVGLAGSTIRGMTFSCFDGRATWDASGRDLQTSSAPSTGDTVAPTVAVTSPADDSTVGGTTVMLTANASDNVGVAGIQFKLNGANLGAEDTSAPFNVTWNSANVANGTYTLTAVARDAAGNRSTSAPRTLRVNNTTPTTSGPGNLVVWVEDNLPSNTQAGGNGGDGWFWTADPAPYSGNRAHQSALAAGLHEHYFDWASPSFPVNAGDYLVTYVYLDPVNPPTEIMVHWNNGSTEHRAYWGANQINYGINGTASRRYMGALPRPGVWARLEVPATDVDLEGTSVRGMTFSVFNGRATWDLSGKTSQPASAPSNLPTLSVSAVDASAAEGTVEPASFQFVRNGSTAGALIINYELKGTATRLVDYRRQQGDMPTTITMPAGASSVRLTIYPVNDTLAEGPESVILNLVDGSGYSVAAAHMATIMIADNDAASIPPPTNNTNVNTGSNVQRSGPASYTSLSIPEVGHNALNILSPSTLEVQIINTKQPDPARVTQLDIVDNGVLRTPGTGEFVVTVDGQPANVTSVGFKRRPLYAPLAARDLRIDNCIYLNLANPVADGQRVEVRNPNANLWPASTTFSAVAQPLRFSPAIHVNQEGYIPGFPKKARVGYYLGSLGELQIPAAGFKIIDAATGTQMFQGALTPAGEVGFTHSPAPYQKVYIADFSEFTRPGEYRLQVDGLGASYPFVIDEGIAMGFARTYALGLYHQRCGCENELPFTRHTHGACHLAPAEVPSPQENYGFTWKTVADKTADSASYQTAPQLKDEGSQKFHFKKKNKVDVSGGHHDAGDYSKYTLNSAHLVHDLIFAVDSFQGVAGLDNLGLPESGDGISDILQEAKWESDFLAKLQDDDGGFYFLVYPKERAYESNVMPDRGDTQVVWPKNTSATAASVAALAQCASSPLFKKHFPADAARYLAKAKLGWEFLMDAINKNGKGGAYQKLTHYGNEFGHDDELAWAACEMFLATGEDQYHQKLKEWYDPANSATYRWGWWRMWESYGHASRSYAFAVRSGRLAANKVDGTYLAKHVTQILACAEDHLARVDDAAYGTSFPVETKRMKSGAWYFSSERAYDITVAYQLDARREFLDAIISNMNYEGGCNPVNVAYVTGLGWKRQREVVHQYAQNDRRVLPPSGIPLGNVQASFAWLAPYKGELSALCYPLDGDTSSPFAFYDRWADAHNISAEFVHTDTARSLASLAFLATLTRTHAQGWKPKMGSITVDAQAPINQPLTATLQVAGMDLSGARILWEAKDATPAYAGSKFTFMPKTHGKHWIEAEAQWPDGRRIFAVAEVVATNSLPNVSVVASTPKATESSDAPGVFTFTRTGNSAAPLTVRFKFSGTAAKWDDYRRPEGDMPESITIPAGATSATLSLRAVPDALPESAETATLTLSEDSAYNTGTTGKATVTISDS